MSILTRRVKTVEGQYGGHSVEASHALSATRWRISRVAGLLVVVISFVASAINVEPPPSTQDPAAIAAWFADNSQQYRVGHFVAGLAFLLFYIPCFAGFCERLQSAEGTPPSGHV
jgi:hypothetical protein